MEGLEGLLAVAEALAVEAGKAALCHYDAPGPVEQKADSTPLTAADRAAHQVIAEGLSRVSPRLPLLSEESPPESVRDRRSWSRYWLVDPLDGTKEFLKRSGEFTVNIALVEDRAPVLGVVHAPVLAVTYSGGPKGAFVRRGGAAPVPIRTRRAPGAPVVLVSRDHAGPETEALLARIPGAVRKSAGSALKLGLIAEGTADLYPRPGTTMEWDTAAGQCVLEAAGGRVTDLAGAPLTYNKETLANPSFLAFGDPSAGWPERLR